VKCTIISEDKSRKIDDDINVVNILEWMVNQLFQTLPLFQVLKLSILISLETPIFEIFEVYKIKWTIL
jgi:hypothetical protein